MRIKSVRTQTSSGSLGLQLLQSISISVSQAENILVDFPKKNTYHAKHSSWLFFL